MAHQQFKPIPELTEKQIQRFWSHVRITQGPDACWEWTGAVVREYGSLSLTVDGKRITFIATRVGYYIQTGLQPPPDKHMAHSCDNPPCIRLKHIFPATPKQNTGDCIEKGRFIHGERNGHALLTATEVLSIRRLRDEGFLCSELAKQFGVHEQTIWSIVYRDRWKHI